VKLQTKFISLTLAHAIYAQLGNKADETS
jgi:hypothetical protein